MRYGVNCNNNGGDGDCEKHLNSDNRVYFPDKRPPQFWALEHHRIQRPCAAFHVGFSVGLIPHPWNKFENSWCCGLRNGFLLFCLKVTGFEWVGLDCLALREVYRLSLIGEEGKVLDVSGVTEGGRWSITCLYQIPNSRLLQINLWYS